MILVANWTCVMMSIESLWVQPPKIIVEVLLLAKGKRKNIYEGIKLFFFKKMGAYVVLRIVDEEGGGSIL